MTASTTLSSPTTHLASKRPVLSSLNPGQRAMVLGISADEVSQTRLQGLGIRRGVSLELVQGGSNPTYMVRVLDAVVAINRDVAQTISLRLIQD